MDREELIKELTDPSAIRKMVFDHVRRIASDYRAKADSGQIEESVEFVLLRDSIKSTFDLQNPFEQQIVEFVLAFCFALSDAITENNRQWLQALSVEET